jgi:hypothetical protein
MVMGTGNMAKAADLSTTKAQRDQQLTADFTDAEGSNTRFSFVRTPPVVSVPSRRPELVEA